MGLRDAFRYLASLPERALRSVAAAAGGASRLVTDTLLPKSLRRTTAYRHLLGNFQRWIIEEVGRVRGAYAPGGVPALPRDYIRRKTVGDLASTVGILAFRFSPLWFFAILGGAAEGSRLFLDRLVAELKKDGAIPPDARIRTAEELLDALQGALQKTASMFDQPPLSKQDLAALKKELRAGYGAVLEKSKGLMPDAEALWQRMTKLRAEEAVPLLRLSGAMALAGAKAAGNASAGLFHEKVVLSYRESLDSVRRIGFARFLARESAPYFRAVVDAFDASVPAWTERMLGRKPTEAAGRPTRRRRASSKRPRAPRDAR